MLRSPPKNKIFTSQRSSLNNVTEYLFIFNTTSNPTSSFCKAKTMSLSSQNHREPQGSWTNPKGSSRNYVTVSRILKRHYLGNTEKNLNDGVAGGIWNCPKLCHVIYKRPPIRLSMNLESDVFRKCKKNFFINRPSPL